MATSGNKRRWVLHFDINNTILMSDHSKGLNTTDNVSRIVCKSAWGKLIQKQTEVGSEMNTETSWILAHDQLTFTKPESPSLLANIPEGESIDTNIVTYNDYIDILHPEVKLQDGTKDPEVEEVRTRLRANFAKPGGPGAKFKNQQEKLFKTLTLPKGAREELGITGDEGLKVEDDEADGQEAGGEEDDDIDAAQQAEIERKKYEKKMNAVLFGEGKYHIIPSFFRMIMYLKKKKEEFSIVFNTFGNDLDNVIYEFNKFCAGEHPCFNGRNNTPLVKVDGSKNQKDLRFRDPSQRVCIYRESEELHETVMVTGGNNRVKGMDEVNQIEETDDVVVYRDHLEIYQQQLETLKKFGSLAVSEDYSAWDMNAKQKDCAKLLMLDQADYITQHIFFDDNADDGMDCIVDVRDVVTGEEIPNDKFMDLYVVKVHPHKAILEPEYFIKKIEECEMRRDDEIHRVESGIEEEEAKQKQQALQSIEGGETEWEKIQKMDDANYLMRTVLPVLYQGMRVVDLERPAAPLEYLALYLLKHQDMIKLPPKAISKKEEPEDDDATASPRGAAAAADNAD